MLTKSHALDCVIVGHNDMSLRRVEEFMRKTQHQSAAYRDFQANSVRFRGERITYMDLLNETLKVVSGKDHDLHICKLPHLGSCCLISFLKNRNLNVELVNFFNREKDRFADLLAESPNAVAITTTLYVDNGPIIEIVDFIRQHNPDTKIVVGGPHINNVLSCQDAETQDFILNEIGADIYVNDSQGELTLSELLHTLRDHDTRDLSSIPNLVYADHDRNFRRTAKRPENNDINETVDWRYFDKQLYSSTVQIRTARSCAFKCSFCRYPALAGQLSLANLETIENNLRFLDAVNVRNIVFIDDTFNVPLPRFKNLCRMMIRNRFSFDWYSFFRCSNSDIEAFDLMRESGCRGVFLGIESADPQILKNMNKFADVDKYREGIRQLREREIVTFASIIVGFPGETRQSVERTIDFLEEAAPTFYRAETYYHYTNVPIHDQAAHYGIKGAGYSWRHNTMNWQEASQTVEEMYRTIRGPIVLPGYMFDFWSIPYLTGQGFSIDQIKGFTKIAQELLLDSFGEASPNASPHEERLLSLFRAS
jgi:radical SAM PhpK family P-methyltransferase